MFLQQGEEMPEILSEALEEDCLDDGVQGWQEQVEEQREQWEAREVQ